MTHGEGVQTVREWLESIGGREALVMPDVPGQYVMAGNWAHARRMEALGARPRSHRMRAEWADRAKTEPEAWDAMVLIIGMADRGQFDRAWYTVRRTIGERPKAPGRKVAGNMARNEFIHDAIEHLMYEGMNLSESLRVLADVLHKDPSAIRRGRQSYLRMVRPA